MLTPKEEELVERFLERFEGRFGCKIGWSSLVRSAIRGIRDCGSGVLDAATEFGTTQRPINGDERGLAKFEKKLAAVIVKGIRKRPKRRKRGNT